MNGARIYVEGGNIGDLHRRCREAFSTLFQKCGFQGNMPRVISCGSRRNAYEDFCVALMQSNRSSVFLLVDTEDPIQDMEKPWDHLKQRDGWDRPDGATDDQVLVMATCMETWIAADQQGLISLYKNCLQVNALPSTVDLENRDRHDVFARLKHATRNCKPPYDKGESSFRALANIDPTALVALPLPAFVRTLRTLQDKL